MTNGVGQLANPNNTDNPAYKARLSGWNSRGICPFCEQHMAHECTGTMIKEFGHWVARHCDPPYPNTEHNVLLVHRKHILKPADMTPEAKLEYWDVLEYVCQKLGIEGGGDAGRWGNPARSGVTLNHLHRIIYAPKRGQFVNVPIGPLPAKPA